MVKALMFVLQWLLKGVQIKFILFSVIGSIFGLFTLFVVPVIADFISPQALTNAFSSIPPTVWYFLNLTNIFSGLPVIISAYASRFIIRRLPFIG